MTNDCRAECRLNAICEQKVSDIIHAPLGQPVNVYNAAFAGVESYQNAQVVCGGAKTRAFAWLFRFLSSANYMLSTEDTIAARETLWGEPTFTTCPSHQARQAIDMIPVVSPSLEKVQ